MKVSDVCQLIQKTTPKGVHETKTETTREVYCEVTSVGRSEFYAAYNQGLKPEYVLKLADMYEYEDETELMFRSKRYNVIRTFVTQDGGIELTIQRSTVK